LNLYAIKYFTNTNRNITYMTVMRALNLT